ncbi:MAG: tetratricopeptide repeat protein, partial [Myxococcota bacterium]
RTASHSAEARGAQLTVRAMSPAGAVVATVVTWKSLDPIARVIGVYRSAGGTLVAVEYEVRFGGRLRTEVVGFALPKAGQAEQAGTAGTMGRPPGEAGGTAAGTTRPTGACSAAQPAGTGTGAGAAPTLSGEAQKALDRARRLAKRGRHSAALAAYRQVLASDGEHAEARYGVARALARQRRGKDAVAELKALAGSQRADAVVWLIEARFDRAFARLRSDAGFRAATGLDRPAGAARPLYERLVGFSRTWEQPEVKCEQEQINLDFDRLKQTFVLRVTSRCGGYKDTVRLAGRWALGGSDRVTLTLPNKGGKDEVLQCALSACGDGEDCLSCGVDGELSFTVRPVRR